MRPGWAHPRLTYAAAFDVIHGMQVLDVMRNFFDRGGPLIWPLVACSLVSLTVTIERIFFWWRFDRCRRRSAAVLESIFWETEQCRLPQALEEAQASPAAIVGVLAAGLRHSNYGFVENMEIAANDAIARMKQGLAVLDTIITMAPLLGILGTVFGIIRSFRVLGAGDISSSVAVNLGVAESLISTAAGITVALLTLVPFNALVSKVQRETRRMEQTIAQFETAFRKGSQHASDHRIRA